MVSVDVKHHVYILTVRSRVNIWFTVRIMCHFMLEEDSETMKVNEPGGLKLETVEFEVVGEA